MRVSRRASRRSFLAQVAGGVIGIGALALIGRAAQAQTGPFTGITDTDSGSYADNAGHGRGRGRNRSGQAGRTGITDNDPRDPRGGGRRRRYTGISDSDSGRNADPAGGGRGRRAPPPPRRLHRQARRRADGVCTIPTGYSDSDRGASRDFHGYGRSGGSGQNRVESVHCL